MGTWLVSSETHDQQTKRYNGYKTDAEEYGKWKYPIPGHSETEPFRPTLEKQARRYYGEYIKSITVNPTWPTNMAVPMHIAIQSYLGAAGPNIPVLIYKKNCILS